MLWVFGHCECLFFQYDICRRQSLTSTAGPRAEIDNSQKLYIKLVNNMNYEYLINFSFLSFKKLQ